MEGGAQGGAFPFAPASGQRPLPGEHCHYCGLWHTAPVATTKLGDTVTAQSSTAHLHAQCGASFADYLWLILFFFVLNNHLLASSYFYLLDSSYSLCNLHKSSSSQFLQNPIAAISIEGNRANKPAIFSLKLLFGETDVRRYLIIHNR